MDSQAGNKQQQIIVRKENFTSHLCQIRLSNYFCKSKCYISRICEMYYYYLDTCVNLTRVNPCFHPRKLCLFLNDQLLNITLITDDIKYVSQQKATLR